MNSNKWYVEGYGVVSADKLVRIYKDCIHVGCECYAWRLSTLVKAGIDATDEDACDNLWADVGDPELYLDDNWEGGEYPKASSVINARNECFNAQDKATIALIDKYLRAFDCDLFIRDQNVVNYVAGILEASNPAFNRDTLDGYCAISDYIEEHVNELVARFKK